MSGTTSFYCDNCRRFITGYIDEHRCEEDRVEEKIREAFKRSWHYKNGCHPVENGNKYTIFADGYKSASAELEKKDQEIELVIERLRIIVGQIADMQKEKNSIMLDIMLINIGLGVDKCRDDLLTITTWSQNNERK